MHETKQKIEYSIRQMEESDIPQVLEVDREAFPTQWPYSTYSSFKQELRNRLAHYIVATRPNEEFSPFYSGACSESSYSKGVLSKLFDIRNLFRSTPAPMASLPPPSQEFILGMAGFWLMVGEAHIITIAVRKSNRRTGIGEKLLLSIIDKAMELNANTVTLEVRVSNSQAQELYKKYGFSPAGLRHKYYSDNGENALIMTTENIAHPSYTLRLQHLKEAYEDRWAN